MRALTAAALCAAILVLVACQEGPGGSSESGLPESKVHEITIQPADFTLNQLPYSVIANAEYQVSMITQADVEQGSVTAAVQTVPGSGVWVALPFVNSIRVQSIPITVTLSYAYTRGVVRISLLGNVTADDMQQFLNEYQGYRVRIVVVPAKRGIE